MFGGPKIPRCWEKQHEKCHCYASFCVPQMLVKTRTWEQCPHMLADKARGKWQIDPILPIYFPPFESQGEQTLPPACPGNVAGMFWTPGGVPGATGWQRWGGDRIHPSFFWIRGGTFFLSQGFPVVCYKETGISAGTTGRMSQGHPAVQGVFGKIDKILPKPRVSKPIFGHSAGSTKLDRPYCKRSRFRKCTWFFLMCLFCSLLLA